MFVCRLEVNSIKDTEYSVSVVIDNLEGRSRTSLAKTCGRLYRYYQRIAVLAPELEAEVNGRLVRLHIQQPAARILPTLVGRQCASVVRVHGMCVQLVVWSVANTWR